MSSLVLQPPAHWNEKLTPFLSMRVQTTIFRGSSKLQHFYHRFFSYFAGPESSIGQNEISLQVPNPSELQAKPPSLSSTSTDPATQDPSEGGESPIVQSDEEGVEEDTALATLHTDDSDS